MNADALAVTDLCVDLGGARVLRDVSLRVRAGSTVALVGRNGAGKTTTLRAFLGLVKAHAGQLQFGEWDLTGLSAHRRARLGIGYVPEDRRMSSAHTVEENLLLPALACKQRGSIRARGLERVYALLPELAEMKQRKAGSLSGGQQKMVALGRAFMIGDRLLLLDEPFQGLAPALARRYAEALADLRAQNPQLAILVSESNPALLGSIAQVSYTIERGKVTLT